MARITAWLLFLALMVISNAPAVAARHNTKNGITVHVGDRDVMVTDTSDRPQEGSKAKEDLDVLEMMLRKIPVRTEEPVLARTAAARRVAAYAWNAAQASNAPLGRLSFPMALPPKPGPGLRPRPPMRRPRPSILPRPPLSSPLPWPFQRPIPHPGPERQQSVEDEWQRMPANPEVADAARRKERQRKYRRKTTVDITAGPFAKIKQLIQELTIGLPKLETRGEKKKSLRENAAQNPQKKPQLELLPPTSSWSAEKAAENLQAVQEKLREAKSALNDHIIKELGQAEAAREPQAMQSMNAEMAAVQLRLSQLEAQLAALEDAMKILQEVQIELEEAFKDEEPIETPDGSQLKRISSLVQILEMKEQAAVENAEVQLARFEVLQMRVSQAEW